MEREFDVILVGWEFNTQGQNRLRGRAFADLRPETAHQGFADGEWITTSEVQTIRQNIAVTKSGTRYLLV